jgi:glucose/arabinose dehydrogenase
MRRYIIALLPLLFIGCKHQEKMDESRLKVPAGFSIDIFAQAPKARMMAFSPGGVLLVTATSDGKVLALPDSKHTGKAEKSVTVLQDLNAPHGIAFHNGKLYIAETNQLQRFDWDESQLHATNGQVIAKYPGSGMHFTRTLLFANGKMYVSIGSDCNVCDEKDKHRAAVMEYNEDGTGERVFASGLRNSVGLAFNEKTGTIWATDNARDWLGDSRPADEINDLGKTGGNFGWPYCYANQVLDVTQAKAGDSRCKNTIAPKVQIEAHSAPLGLAYYNGTLFPSDYKGDLLVALHGSWNRSRPSGYKVIRVQVGDKGEAQIKEDFVTGWIRPGETRKGVWMGRPVDVIVGPEGAVYISDDAAGVVYRVAPSKPLSS